MKARVAGDSTNRRARFHHGEPDSVYRGGMPSWTIRRYARAIDRAERDGGLAAPRQAAESREEARRRIAADLFAVWREQRLRVPPEPRR